MSNWFRRGLIVVFWSVGLATTDLFAASMALLLGQIKATFLVTLFASLTGGTIFYLLGKDDLVLKSSTWITQQEEKLRGKRLVEWCLRRGKLFTILIIAAVSGPMSAALALRLFGYKDTRSYVQIGVNAFLFALVWAGVIWGIPACFIRKAL